MKYSNFHDLSQTSIRRLAVTDRAYLIVCNGTVLTPYKEIKDGMVIVQGSRIVDVGQRGQIQEPVDAATVDAKGHYIVPGLIDIHVHGGKGANVLDASLAALETISNFLVTRGVTAFVATMSTAPVDQFLASLECVRSVKRNGDLPGAQVLGVHQEGPFLNPAQKGAHPENLLLPPTLEHFKPFLEYVDVLMIMTLAPELDGAVGLIRALCDAGVIAAAGHTNGIYREFVPAIDAGLSHAVHCFCNMSTLRRDNLKRVAGAVETVLYDDRITTELIGDGWHVGDSLMKLALKAKGPQRVCWVTDAMSATGMPPGRYFVRGVEVVVEEKGIARLPDNTAYAGSVTTLDVCVRNGIQRIGLNLRDAVRMATSTPAAIVGVDDRKGSLEVGKDADIVVMDANADIRLTIARGCVVYRGW
jgi:N-acetylglucosamine-6-phosphate deacetylase